MNEKGKRTEATDHFKLPDPRLGIGNLEHMVESDEKGKREKLLEGKHKSIDVLQCSAQDASRGSHTQPFFAPFESSVLVPILCCWTVQCYFQSCGKGGCDAPYCGLIGFC